MTLDGAEVVYDTRLTSNSSAGDLFAVPISGGTARQLNPPGEPASLFQLSPDGIHVAYIGPGEADESYQLDLASLVPGTGVVPLTGPGSLDVFPGAPTQFFFDSTGGRIVYLTRFVVNAVSGASVFHLHAVRTSGFPEPERLDVPAIDPSSVTMAPFWMRFALGDSLAVYLADLERNNVFEVWGSWLEKRKFDRR